MIEKSILVNLIKIIAKSIFKNYYCCVIFYTKIFLAKLCVNAVHFFKLKLSYKIILAQS